MHLILFDCDGTLVDSQHYIVAAMIAAFDAMGLAHPPREAILATVGLSLPAAFARLLDPSSGIDPRDAAATYRKSAIEMHEAGEIEPLYEGARLALEQLSARPDVLLGVATGKGRRGLDAILAGHALGEHFTITKTADDAASKPHPQMVWDAAHELGVDLSQVVLVGDTTFDMEMARNAGVKAIGVTWGYHTAAQMADHDPLAIIDDFAALVPQLHLHFGWA